MDLIPEPFRLGLESNLEALYNYIEGLELKQRFDITMALTGNIKDYLEFKKCKLTTKENHELCEDEKNALCGRIVDGALGDIPKQKLRKSKKFMKVPRVKADMARLLYEGEYCTTCNDCGGFKCCLYK